MSFSQDHLKVVSGIKRSVEAERDETINRNHSCNGDIENVERVQSEEEHRRCTKEKKTLKSFLVL